MAGLTALRLILGFSIVSTATHYTHNFVAVDDYPGGGPGLQIAIVLSWPVLTAVGLYGYRLYTEGRFREAQICLLLYAPLGLLTPAHFLSGEPDVPPIFYATIFTDGLAGLAIVGFVVWSALIARAAQSERHRNRFVEAHRGGPGLVTDQRLGRTGPEERVLGAVGGGDVAVDDLVVDRLDADREDLVADLDLGVALRPNSAIPGAPSAECRSDVGMAADHDDPDRSTRP